MDKAVEMETNMTRLQRELEALRMERDDGLCDTVDQAASEKDDGLHRKASTMSEERRVLRGKLVMLWASRMRAAVKRERRLRDIVDGTGRVEPMEIDIETARREWEIQERRELEIEERQELEIETRLYHAEAEEIKIRMMILEAATEIDSEMQRQELKIKDILYEMEAVVIKVRRRVLESELEALGMEEREEIKDRLYEMEARELEIRKKILERDLEELRAERAKEEEAHEAAGVKDWKIDSRIQLLEVNTGHRLLDMEARESRIRYERVRLMELKMEREEETKSYPPVFGRSVCFEIDFNSQSVANLHERLFGKGREEESLKKLVYLRVSCRDSSSNISWLSVDANADTSAVMKPESSFPPKLLPNVAYVSSLDPRVTVPVSVSCVDEDITSPRSSFPPQLRHLTCYGCTVWKSTIIIAGGKWADHLPSSQVFFYHMDSKTWTPPVVMLRPRDAKPTVVGAGSHLFVFGGITDADPASWAEVYIPGCCPAFKFLPTIPASPERITYKIISHAVYKNQDQILLLIDPCEILSFNFIKMEWGMSGCSTTIAKGLHWSDTVVLFEDFLIWHHYGTIYLHDIQNHITVPACPMSRTAFSSAMFDDKVSPPRFLVHTGRGKLCLFYLAGISIRYITFWVQISQSIIGCGPQIPDIVIGHSGYLYTPPISDVHHALEVRL